MEQQALDGVPDIGAHGPKRRLGDEILVLLRQRGPMTIDQLAPLLNVPRGSVAGAVNALNGYKKVRSLNGRKPNLWTLPGA